MIEPAEADGLSDEQRAWDDWYMREVRKHGWLGPPIRDHFNEGFRAGQSQAAGAVDAMLQRVRTEFPRVEWTAGTGMPAERTEAIRWLAGRLEVLTLLAKMRDWPEQVLGEDESASVDRFVEHLQRGLPIEGEHLSWLAGQIACRDADVRAACQSQTERELEALGADLAKYEQKARIYGDLAARYRNAAIASGGIGKDDRFEATWNVEWEGRLEAIRRERDELRIALADRVTFIEKSNATYALLERAAFRLKNERDSATARAEALSYELREGRL